MHENRRNEALIAAELGCKLFPSYTDEDNMSNSNHAEALRALSQTQSSMVKRHESLESARKSTAIHKQLAEQSPAAYNPYLASSLNNL